MYISMIQGEQARFRVGDRVRVISYDPIDYTAQWWSSLVAQHKGEGLTIREVCNDEHGFYYEVDEYDISFDESWLYFADDFISKDDDGDIASEDLSFLVSDFVVR